MTARRSEVMTQVGMPREMRDKLDKLGRMLGMKRAQVVRMGVERLLTTYASAIQLAEAKELGVQCVLPCNSQDHDPRPILPGEEREIVIQTEDCAVSVQGYQAARVSAPYFRVMSIRYQKREYLRDGGEDAAAFCADSETSPSVSLPCVWPEGRVTVRVRNTGAEPRHYWSQFVGQTLLDKTIQYAERTAS